MRRLLPILILLCSAGAGAQERHRLAGFVQMPGNAPSSYYLDLTITDTRVTGYSITDYTGGNRLKASIVGRRSPASELYIQETGSLDGPNTGIQVYCYFKAHLKLEVANGKARWTGPFESRQADGTPCFPTNGIMSIMDNAPELDAPKLKPAPRPPAKMQVQVEAPKALPKPAPTPLPPPPPPKDTVKPAPKKEVPKPKPVVVIPPRKAIPPAPIDTNNCLRSYDWKSDTLSLDIWDGFLSDGDVVSVAFGGKLLMDHVTLGQAKQRLSVPLARGTNILFIYFHEEGFDKPNTPNMILHDGELSYDLNIGGNFGQVARICFNRAR